MRQLRNNDLARSLARRLPASASPATYRRVQVPALVFERAADDVEPAVGQGLIAGCRLHRRDVRLQHLEIVEPAERVLGALDGANPCRARSVIPASFASSSAYRSFLAAMRT